MFSAKAVPQTETPFLGNGQAAFHQGRPESPILLGIAHQHRKFRFDPVGITRQPRNPQHPFSCPARINRHQGNFPVVIDLGKTNQQGRKKR